MRPATLTPAASPLDSAASILEMACPEVAAAAEVQGHSTSALVAAGPGGFSFNNPEDIFAEFLRSQSGGARGGSDEDDINNIFSSFGGGGGGGRPGRSSRMRTSFGDPRGREQTPEVTTVERPLPMTLEELFNGVTKKMKIKRKTFDDSGKRVQSDTILEVPIKPGLKKGSKIKFNGVGDQVEGGRQDLHFIVEEVSPLNSLSYEIIQLLTVCYRKSIRCSSERITTSSTRSCSSSRRR